MPVEYLLEGATMTDLSGLQFAKFLNVAALAAFAFDYCLTFSSEVEYVWGTKWEISRALFTLSRYLAVISASLVCYGNLNPSDRCNGFVFATDAIYYATIIFAEGILILRTYALWGRSKRVLFFLLFLAVAFIIGGEVISRRFKVILPKDSNSSYQFNASLCAYRSSRNYVFQYNFLVGYEIILQSMSSWKKFRTYRNFASRTLSTLYWDGILYMSWVIVLSGANIAVMLAAPIGYIPALDTAQVALHSVLACRIFFNLRECDKQLRSLGDEVSLETVRYRERTSADVSTRLASQIETVHSG